MFISIIVPIYNVEKFLNDCINSILNQTYRNIEILLINDGSTDDSGLICDEYTSKDSRIRVFHKENGGLSDARNYGLLKAKGEYVYFIDSDDFLIRDDTIEILYNNLLKHNCQISCANYIDYYLNLKEDIPLKNKKDFKLEILNKKEAIKNMYEYNLYKSSFGVAWNKLYKKSLFDKINYPYGKLHEDEFTTYKLYLEAEKIVFVDLATYAYRQRDGSIMKSDYNLRKLDSIEALEERIDILKENCIDTLETEYNYLILLSYHIYMLRKYNYDEEFRAYNNKFKNYFIKTKNKFYFKRRLKLIILKNFNAFYYKYILKY